MHHGPLDEDRAAATGMGRGDDHGRTMDHAGRRDDHRAIDPSVGTPGPAAESGPADERPALVPRRDLGAVRSAAPGSVADRVMWGSCTVLQFVGVQTTCNLQP